MRTVVDVGGGIGALLAKILRVHSGVRGTLVDLPATVARSKAVFQKVAGKDRTLSEFRQLGRAAGLDLQAAGRHASGRFIVECVPDRQL